MVNEHGVDLDALYSHGGLYPTTLPHRILVPNASGGVDSRTDPEQFTPEMLAAAGWVLAGPRPEESFDDVVYWDYDAVQWQTRLRTEVEKAEVLSGLKAQAQDRLNSEYRRRIAEINEHIAAGQDGMDILEATLKSARELAEVVGSRIVQWIDANTGLSPPATLADIDGATFVATLRQQPELAEIIDRRAVRVSKQQSLDAAATPADVAAMVADIPSGWPVA